MIRRRVDDEFWLFTQHDHALLAGQLAEEFGNHAFAAPDPRDATIRGVAMHDCGWPLHDDEPTLNNKHEPLDVFETPPHVGLKVWSEASRRAAELDPYAGLLVSLHSLSLSMFAMSPDRTVANEKWDATDPRTRFEANQFQHAQLELQETLRRRLGLRTDLPTQGGIVTAPTEDPRELALRFNFRLLQAMDKISLCVCCTEPPFTKIEPLETQPGHAPQSLRVHRPTPATLHLSPWPFALAELE